MDFIDLSHSVPESQMFRVIRVRVFQGAATAIGHVKPLEAISASNQRDAYWLPIDRQ